MAAAASAADANCTNAAPTKCPVSFASSKRTSLILPNGSNRRRMSVSVVSGGKFPTYNRSDVVVVFLSGNAYSTFTAPPPATTDRRWKRSNAHALIVVDANSTNPDPLVTPVALSLSRKHSESGAKSSKSALRSAFVQLCGSPETKSRRPGGAAERRERRPSALAEAESTPLESSTLSTPAP